MANLYEGIIRSDQEFLAQILASIRNSNVFLQMWKKIQEKFTKENEYQKVIDKEKRKLMDKYSQEQLFWMTLTEYNKILNIPNRKYESEEDVKENCREIEILSVRMYNEQRASNEPSIHNYDQFLHKMSQRLFQAIFKDLKEVDWEELDIHKQDEIIEKLMKFINDELPEEQQARILEALKIDKLTQNELRKAIRNSGLWAVFSALVSVAGFGFYFGIMAMIAGVMSIIGLSLPFAVFAGVATLIAIAATPVFLLFLLGFQAFGIRKKSGTSQKEIAMMHLLLITMVQNDPQKKPMDIQLLLSYFKDADLRIEKIQNSLHEAEIKRGELNRNISQLNDRLYSLRRHISKKEDEMSEEITLIVEALTNQDKNGVLANEPDYSSEFKRMILEREVYYEQNRNEPIRGSFLNKAVSTGRNIVKDFKRELDETFKEAEHSKMADALARRLWKDGRTDLLIKITNRDIINRLKEITSSIKELENEMVDTQARIKDEEKEIRDQNAIIQSDKKELEILQRQNPYIN